MAPKKKRSNIRGKVEKNDAASSYMEALEIADEVRMDFGKKLQTGEFGVEEMKKVLQDPEVMASCKKIKYKEAFDMVKNLDKIEKKADEEISRKLTSLSLGLSEPNVTYCDSDQSPLRFAEAQILKYQWATGLDYIPTKAHLSKLLKVL